MMSFANNMKEVYQTSCIGYLLTRGGLSLLLTIKRTRPLIKAFVQDVRNKPTLRIDVGIQVNNEIWSVTKFKVGIHILKTIGFPTHVK